MGLAAIWLAWLAVAVAASNAMLARRFDSFAVAACLLFDVLSAIWLPVIGTIAFRQVTTRAGGVIVGNVWGRGAIDGRPFILTRCWVGPLVGWSLTIASEGHGAPTIRGLWSRKSVEAFAARAGVMIRLPRLRIADLVLQLGLD
jgi:hypothetical protein